METTVTIAFEEAAKGCTKTISYGVVESCADCGGSGAAKGTSPKTCPACHGTGQVSINQRTPFGVVQTQRTCDRCHGAGKIVDSPCHSCNGTGRTRKQRTVEVKIPEGIDDGQMISIGSHGNAGANGGPSGDLLVEVRVRPHAIFERRGNDEMCIRDSPGSAGKWFAG